MSNYSCSRCLARHNGHVDMCELCFDEIAEQMRESWRTNLARAWGDVPIGVTDSGMKVYGTIRVSAPAHCEKFEVKVSIDTCPTVSKYAGRDCPCGMPSSNCEYHR